MADARALLEQMRLRLERGPFVALGVAETATAPVARAAFLQLTKTYHPAKFAREAPDIVRQANEIFLSLRAAYDQIAQPSKRATQAVPILPAAGRGPGSSRSGLGSPGPPIGHAAAPAAHHGAHPAAAPATPPPPVVTLKSGSPSGPSAAPSGTSAQRQPARPGVAPIPKPGSGTVSGIGVPSRPDSSRTPSIRSGPAAQPPPAGASTPPAAAPPAPTRSGTGGAAAIPAPAPSPPLRGTQVLPKLSDGVIPGSEEADLEIAMHFIKRKQWSDARKQLHALAARVPADKRYRALLSYARGREQQDDGRHDEARAEFHRALQLDPDLYMAKAALQQVGAVSNTEEPEKPSGGLFSRLFKK